MGTNFYTAWINKPTPGFTQFEATSMNPALASLDRGITYLKNVMVGCEGTLSWNPTTGELAWSAQLTITFNRDDGDACHNHVATGSVTLTAGQFAYLDLSETDGAEVTVSAGTITTGDPSNFIAFNRLVLVYRSAASGALHFISLDQPFVPAGESNANRTLYPEYPGAVMTPSGSNNDPGTEGMTSDSEVVSNVRHNYYEWSSSLATGLQSYDVVVQIPIPFNFIGFQTGVSVALTLDIKTEENTTTNNKLDVIINRDGQATTSSLTDQKSASAATWETIGFDETDAVLAALVAGETLNVAIRMYSQSSKYARIGKINLQIKLT
jgi:hypothetical protein